MDVKIHSEQVMRRLIKEMKTQTAVAKALGQSKQVFNYWLNHANKVPFDQYLAMKTLLEKITSSFSKEADINESTKNRNSSTVEIPSLEPPTKISLRTRLAMEFEAQILHELTRTRYRGSSGIADQNPKCSAAERAVLLASKRYGFTNKHHYVQAKKVVLTDIAELTQAMDDQSITPRQVVKIIDAVRRQQHTRRTMKRMKSKQAIIHSGKDQENTSKIIRNLEKEGTIKGNIFFNSEIYQHGMLMQLEQCHQVPLRSILVGLLMVCDENNQFLWDLWYLKSMLLPYIDLNFAQCFDLLCEHGFIKKIKIAHRFYGRLLPANFIHSNRTDDGEMIGFKCGWNNNSVFGLKAIQ